MKTLFVLFAILAFTTASFAQKKIIFLRTDSATIIDQKVRGVKTITTAVVEKNGSVVFPDGRLKGKDGTTAMLANGDGVDENGNLIKIDTCYNAINYLFMNNGKMILVTDAIKSSPGMDEYIRFVNGKAWITISMTTGFTTKNGTTIMPDGIVKTMDGKTSTMKEDDGIDENGNKVIVSDLESKPINCVFKYDGKMMSLTLLTKEITLKNGFVVMADGTVKPLNASPYKLVEGGLINLDGTMLLGRMPEKK